MTSPPNTEQRIRRLRRLLRESDADAILITNFTNVTYLTGFTGDDSYLLIYRDGLVLLTDSRYTLQLQEECPGLDLVVRRPGVTMTATLTKLIRKVKPRSLAIEADSMTVSQLAAISHGLPKLQTVTTSGLVERLRMVKDRQEIQEIRQAITIAERAITLVRASLRAGQSEKEIADEIEHQARQFGGRCCSFPPIVAFGSQSALPHATPGLRRLEIGQFVLIDWGVQGRLYVSDLTRIFAIGRISPKLERIYKVVLTAQRRAIESIKPKAKACDVDAVARSVIAEAGFGKHFGHGLGHGIGLKVHEAPRMAVGQTELLQAGMVLTVEPGIYLPGWGGVRIEDDVLVTRNGHEVLSSVPKNLVDCVVA